MREYSIGTLIDMENSLPPHLRDRLAELGRERRYDRGETVYSQGDPAGSIFLVRSGQAKSVLVNDRGDHCLLRLHLRHSLLGLTALATNPIRDATATASTELELTQLSRARFVDEMLSCPDLAVVVTRLLVDRMKDFHHRVGDFLTQSVEQRLAQSLLSLSRPDPDQNVDGSREEIRLTHEELAGLLGARRPTITAILNRFVSEGRIAKKGRAIVVVDAERLRHLVFGP
ncbi:MAG: Crp/Fnr family transcriptional regulator [Geminicoccaceae bacterium]